ncbi:MAG: GNAT family protein [Pseudomonadota bacterium]
MDKIKISFRPMHESDLDCVSKWLEDFEDVELFERGLPIPVSREFIQESWKPSLQYAEQPRAFWFVVEDENANPIGMGGIQSINYLHGDGVIPIFVSRPYRRQGLAETILAFLVELAFSRLRLYRVSTNYREDNEASKKTLKKLGFAEEGRIRKGCFCGGGRKDQIYVGLLSEEWFENRKRVFDRLSGNGFYVENGMSVLGQ